mmetsp:Transcript_22715/g.63164  ORF Transcript_22715/g.63164 Transcript_22715/m.63164 type:complete len:214 (+) Transcript_22715:289-930(+)
MSREVVPLGAKTMALTHGCEQIQLNHSILTRNAQARGCLVVGFGKEGDVVNGHDWTCELKRSIISVSISTTHHGQRQGAEACFSQWVILHLQLFRFVTILFAKSEAIQIGRIGTATPYHGRYHLALFLFGILSMIRREVDFSQCHRQRSELQRHLMTNVLVVATSSQHQRSCHYCGLIYRVRLLWLAAAVANSLFGLRGGWHIDGLCWLRCDG